MTVSMHKMSAGDGYQYLLRSVVAGDGDRSLSTPLTRYYAEAGTPPGRWMGSGVGEFGQGKLAPGTVVSEAQLELLLSMGRDPVTGERLGSGHQTFATVRKRVEDRIEVLNPHLNEEERAAMVDEIEVDEARKGARTATAGFDYTFSVPKSVSVLWSVADAGTQSLIVEAHHEAVAEVLAFVEREVAVTRAGANARDGASAQHAVRGVAATAYDHWDSRAGDPQLHTHVVVANKVRTDFDGKWRTLDSRALFASVVAVSEHYNAVLADVLTRSFGVEWERRARGANRNLAFEIEGVSEALISEFSNRSRAIDIEKDRLIEEHVVNHSGRRPGLATIIKLRAEATLRTRPEKHVRSLAELTADWRPRATRLLGADATTWARALTTGGARGLLRADDITPDAVHEVARAAVGQVSEKRSTWKHWNLWAEASRQTVEWRFASVADREAVVDQIVEEAKRVSVALTPPELAFSPGVFRRSNGTSLFRPQHSIAYSSEEILAAEGRLITRADDMSATTVEASVVKAIAQKEVLGHLLSDEQVRTLSTIAVSGRQVDLLIGPAGAGKTTAMRALHNAWTEMHGSGSVIGLAPSAAAAQVLAEDLGIECDNTAKRLHEHDHGRAEFKRDQLVIVDEATLAGTLTLDRLTGLAAGAGAKVLLVGDWAQLQSVDAGGAFPLLAAARTDVPELTEVRRFTHEWEKASSLDLRHGRIEAISAYVHHDRVREGAVADMIDAAYLAWRADVRAGRSSVLVTEASRDVIDLNERARAERIRDGETSASQEVELADGTRASVGDLVITRRNERRIKPMRGGWVRNGDRWRVCDVRDDGSIVIQRLGMRVGASVVLPAGYVAEHVDLGYAITAHRAQGITVDTSHVVVSGATTRENLYVSMTRGRDSNVAYVALDRPDDSHAAPSADDVTARTILFGVLQHSGVELSAHQMIEDEQERWSSVAQLAAEYNTIAAEAQRDRWIAELERTGLTDEQVDGVAASDSFGVLTVELRRAEANHYEIAKLLPDLVVRRGFEDAEDIGAVLLSRIQHATSRPKRGNRGRPPRLIAGLIPVADGPMDEEMARALTERQELMESRVAALVEAAISKREPWLTRLGEAPEDLQEREHWTASIGTVVAYRDRYGVTSQATLGAEADTDAQKLDRSRAREAIRQIEEINSGRLGDVAGVRAVDVPTLG